jgi:type V secretory pathway adhesin AidA
MTSDGDVRRSHVYGIANVYYEFLDGTIVDVSGVELENRPEQWTGELGLGGTLNWNDSFAIYGEVQAGTSLANFGELRVRWDDRNQSWPLIATRPQPPDLLPGPANGGGTCWRLF